jgi:hypothetical protein
MLEEMTTIGDERIVSWQPHGKAFRVHLADLFVKTVMPRYFSKQTKYKSFLRQLHIYGFHRIGKGMDRGAYCHSMFIRNKRMMSLRMACQKIKGKKSSNTAQCHAAVDPDLSSSFATNLDKNQNQDRHSLITSTLLFNQEVADFPSRSHPQLIGSAIGLGNWSEQAKTMLSKRDEEGQASPDNWYDSIFTEKVVEASATLDGVNCQKQGDECLFAGKRFFYVVEDFNSVINRRASMSA